MAAAGQVTYRLGAMIGAGLALISTAVLAPVAASPCRQALQGSGVVVDVIDARTLRLDDGRDVHLVGIELSEAADAALAVASLRQLAIGRAVTLHGASDTPDRYGRQPALVFLDQAASALQVSLVAEGVAVHDGGLRDAECADALAVAEAGARVASAGIWNGAVIKSAKSSGDILTQIGRFAIVEGKVLSVRQAGATTYLNFGRRWTQDFAVTISRRALPSIEAAGVSVKSLEGKSIRVRGWVGARGGPRIEVTSAAQIEMGAN